MKRFIILTVVLTAGLTGCDDLLDTKPLSQISQTDYFKNETDLQLFSNPFYNNLLDKNPYDDQSDLIVCQTLSDEMLGGNKRTVPASGGGWTWTDLRRMNTLLEYSSQCPDEDVVTKYNALTRFFRAFFYFEKVKRFGDVPWYDVQLGSADEALYKPRDSRELIMTKMIEDVDFAINELTSDVSTYRVNRWAALALKAQFCLYEGTYRKYHNVNLEGHDYAYYLDLAAKAAKELIDDGPYKLYKTGNPEKDYLTLFAQENASQDEYILAIKFDYGLGIYHNATAFTLVSTQGRPGYTRKFINMYLMKDGTAFTDRTDGWQVMSFIDEVKDRDPRLAQSIRTPGYTRIGQTEVLAPDLGTSVTGYQPIKFVQDPTDSGGQVDRNDRSTCDIPVYRYAEVLLNYAEAKAELGTLTQADLDISVNEIRDRVGMPDLDMTKANANPDRYLSSEEYGFTNVNDTNKGVILEIRRERAIELMQEGFRFDDLVRWKAGYCIDQPITGMYFKGADEYDLSGDGKTDLILYAEGTAKPDAGTGVMVYQIGEGITLSDGNWGYLSYHKNVERTKFNEERDYLYPIPTDERSLNKNLTQNPGWVDGLDY
ncbi:MAG: RagB/SusD family nutrient uptake outer membrane protein [Alistipes sp.]|uniref:RagB/SusD family nutrient uptake outer membrane protein n=1 Tax=Alistipes sp. TaxID=1872444 RepID=UPI0025BE96BC|nr:RagB/SusD family nutrient uptake outer membrane protein [Alistipes sp.]MCD8276174.1 RagB/SusD family nutrient uptake outer membrane protein [Alistipes sp.]